jgi:hypothetical protein
LEALCPYFQKVDELLGHRQNVIPSDVREPELPESDTESMENQQSHTFTADDHIPEQTVAVIVDRRNSTGSQRSSTKSNNNSKSSDFSSKYTEMKSQELNLKRKFHDDELELKKQVL